MSGRSWWPGPTAPWSSSPRPIAQGDEVDLLVLQEPDAVSAWLVERGTTTKPHATLRLSPAGSRT